MRPNDVALHAAPDTDTATPEGFDPQQFPILAAHFFGVDPIANPDIVFAVGADTFPPAPLRRTAGGAT